MNIDETHSAIHYIKDTCRCSFCKAQYEIHDIQILASNKVEGIFEAYCTNCETHTIISVLIAPELEIREQNAARAHRGISQNEVLDMKNFLNRFDGNFKKIFKKQA